MRSPALLFAAALLVAGCPSPAPEAPDGANVTPTSTDPLGKRPTLGAPIPYRAPEPVVFETAQGTEVWLVERHEVPVVAVEISVPVGSAADPVGKAGLAHITASMLDEGAGSRDAIAISSDIQTLGAQLYTDVNLDGSRVSLQALKKHLPKAFGIFADVVARPRFDPKEWERLTKLWFGNLEKRSDSPEAVASVVRQAVLYGADTPYGHPIGGYLEAAKKTTLDDAKRFYQRTWRPDRAKLVIAGDITRAEVEALVREHLSDWKKPAEAPVPSAIPPQPLENRPRLVLVDRPEAPQAVLTMVGSGVTAGDAALPLLELVNTALGGSFTSRLNQNLREDHGWTYGARSRFVETRGVGPFIASSAVDLPVTGPALREMLAEIDKMAESGLTKEEFEKTRARDLVELIQTHETVGSLAGRLTSLAMLGLPLSHDAKASEARQAASLEQVNALARQHLDPASMSIVVVGPKKVVLPQLEVVDVGEPVIFTAEGRPASDP